MLRRLARLLGLSRRPAAARARPLPPGMERVHLFAGSFGNAHAAQDYVYPPVHPDIADAPAPMTVDLPEAYIDPARLWLGHGSGLEPLLEEYFRDEMLLDIKLLVGTDDTVVVLEEAAMGGFPFRLSDTPRLRYLGPFERPL